MRLDHLLSKEEKTFSVWSNPTKTEEGVGAVVYCLVTKERVRRPEGCVHVMGPSQAVRSRERTAGGDAPGGDTRTHPEHDG